MRCRMMDAFRHRKQTGGNTDTAPRADPHRPQRAQDLRPPQPPPLVTALADLDQVRLKRHKVVHGVVNEYNRAGQRPKPGFHTPQAGRPPTRIRPVRNASRLGPKPAMSPSERPQRCPVVRRRLLRRNKSLPYEKHFDSKLGIPRRWWRGSRLRAARW